MKSLLFESFFSFMKNNEGFILTLPVSIPDEEKKLT